MNKVYISYCTEYEAGWGQRPDGFLISIELEPMKNEIDKSNRTGKPSYYWKYTEPSIVFCNDETLNNIKFDMGDKGFVSYSQNKKIKLYKEI